MLLRFSDDQFTTSFITTIGCANESAALAERANDGDDAENGDGSGGSSRSRAGKNVAGAGG